jgi:hypothetical protein
MQGLTNANNPYGSAFSNDGRLSPTPSYATSIQDTIDGHFAPTIGFASNLSHTVIKEQDDERSLHSGVSDETADEDLNDDELALIGPPWAKEGILWRRTGNEAALRKTAKKDWKQFFVVVQRGELSMHTFGSGSGSNTFGTVGGGNWTVSVLSASSSSWRMSRPALMLILEQRQYRWSVFARTGCSDRPSRWIRQRSPSCVQHIFPRRRDDIPTSRNGRSSGRMGRDV